MSATGYFVTGTDTEVGKTLVTAALIRGLAQRGLKVAGMKPVATGAQPTSKGLRAEDAINLMRVANVEADYASVNPYAFVPAISPHIAADEAEQAIDLGVIEDRFQCLSALADVVLVEGVGGWLAPLSKNLTVADLACRLDLPVVLVVGMRLGCLNHALLTVSAIQLSGLPLLGWVANCIEPDMARLDVNVQTLRARIDAPFLGILPYQPGVKPEQCSGKLVLDKLL